MLKSRLIFTLLYDNGIFSVSRNFNLQSVGNLNWLKDNYDFESIARSVDELIILNVSRGLHDKLLFFNCIKELSSFSFMPIAVGGNIRTIEDAHALFNSGADKLVLNTPYFMQPEFIRELIKIYGTQAIVASIDFKKNSSGFDVFINNGSKKTNLNLVETIFYVEKLGAGEIFLTSIDRDGTGQGYDLEALEITYKISKVPIIASGGADTFDKLTEGIKSNFTDAVSTSHLFNFMGDGLFDAREQMLNEGVKLSRWEFKHDLYD
jgi:cyclase